MSTDTKAVARFDYFRDSGMERHSAGDYVLFTDHERVAAELREEVTKLKEARALWFCRAGSYLKRAQAAEDALKEKTNEVH